MSSAAGFGAIEGFIQALVTAYAMYKPANNNPGKIAAANSLNGDNCAITE